MQIKKPVINQIIVWVTPKKRRHIKLKKLGLPQIKGFSTKKTTDYTIKISRTCFLNIYIKRPVLTTLLNISSTITDFYKFVANKTGYEVTGFDVRICNVQASFKHSFNHYALITRRELLQQQNFTFIDLKEELHFKHKHSFGTLSLLPKRGTIISKDLVEYSKFVKYIQEQILF